MYTKDKYNKQMNLKVFKTIKIIDILNKFRIFYTYFKKLNRFCTQKTANLLLKIIC